jgi:putative ABC transport system permease protein
MGIRLALGATPAAVLGLVVGDAFRLVGAGIAIGLGAALGLTQLLRSLLFGVSATDPVTYLALAALLCAVALIASVVAGRRATSVDPALALRAE